MSRTAPSASSSATYVASKPCRSFAVPTLGVLDCLGSLGAFQMSTQVLAPDDAEDLGVDDVGRRMIAAGAHALPDRSSARTTNHHFTQARGVNHQHLATGHAARSLAQLCPCLWERTFRCDRACLPACLVTSRARAANALVDHVLEPRAGIEPATSSPPTL